MCVCVCVCVCVCARVCVCVCNSLEVFNIKKAYTNKVVLIKQHQDLEKKISSIVISFIVDLTKLDIIFSKSC